MYSFMCQRRKTKRDSHPDNILHVKILQWCDVGVVTFVVLQDHLLDDTIQQQPVLHRVTAPLIYRHRNTEFPISLLAWAASPPARQKVLNEVGATVAVWLEYITHRPPRFREEYPALNITELFDSRYQKLGLNELITTRHMFTADVWIIMRQMVTEALCFQVAERGKSCWPTTISE